MSDPTRRDFLSTTAAGLGSGWLLLNLPLLASLSACAREAAEKGAPFAHLSPEEGRVLDAFVARILPSDDGTPGAAEAGAAYFVDAAIGGPFQGMAPPVHAGLAELDARARNRHPVGFAELDAAQRDALIGEFEESPLFFPLRLLTVAGVMADPAYGGNREHAGWSILEMEHAAGYQPPFGYYDAAVARGGRTDSGTADGGAADGGAA